MNVPPPNPFRARAHSGIAAKTPSVASIGIVWRRRRHTGIGVRECRNPEERGDPADPANIGLQDVHSAGVEICAELREV